MKEMTYTVSGNHFEPAWVGVRLYAIQVVSGQLAARMDGGKRGEMRTASCEWAADMQGDQRRNHTCGAGTR